MKYHIQVQVGGDPWTGNQIEYDTVELAEEAARDLFSRWTLVQMWRVVDDDGKCVSTCKQL